MYCVRKFTEFTVNTLSVQTEILRHVVPLVTHMVCVFFGGEGHHRNVEKLNGPTATTRSRPSVRVSTKDSSKSV